ncbi:ATP-binding protein [uncultured Caulobacter sp.]|uniref:ATP-binding protein n=1 Tax=uncultured Caulobacter sp. TaxID=158749 RepID=UPI00261F74B0|nr:ATP-binding protein [uncultured Caulobacter sp.]
MTSVTARSLPTLGVRLAICAATALVYALAVDMRGGLLWGLAVATAEAGVWVCSRPQRDERPVGAAQRMAYVAAVTWMNVVWWSLAIMLWRRETPALRLAAFCVVSSFLVHAQAFTARSKTLLLIIGGGSSTLLLLLCGVFNDFPLSQRVALCASAIILITYTAKAAQTNGQQGRALERAKSEAEAASQAKSEFLALMSHELRTPLNGMLGLSQALKLGRLAAEQRDQVELLEESGRTLMGLLNDVLDFAKIEAGKLEIAPIAGDLRQLVDRVVRINEPQAREKGTTITLRVDDSVPAELVFDPLRVRQCLANLISNAVKFTPFGQILVRVACEPAEADRLRIKVSVADTGIGIRPDVLERLFTPFVQADAATARRTGGTGLGLNITRRLAQMMGGAVTARSEVGKGSTFVLTFLCDLPVAKLAEAEPVSPLRLLVVDDYPINRKVIERMLTPLGYEVAEAGDGEGAIEALGQGDFDMMLIDFNMPRMSGLEATRRIRAERRWDKMPIICLTAGVMDDERSEALSAGMDAFIEKPIEMATLVSTIGRLNRRAAAG